MPPNLSLLEAQEAGHIAQIGGTGSNIGMKLDLVNSSTDEVTIVAEPGTVIASKDPNTQRMVVSRRRSWVVPPQSRTNVTVDALCMEAHKAPPTPGADSANHSVEGPTDSGDVAMLLSTLGKVETEISANIKATEPESGEIVHTLSRPGLVTLATASSHTRDDDLGSFRSQVRDDLVQMPLWEITDGLDMVEYAKIIGRGSPGNPEELRDTVNMLSTHAQIAEVLLSEAELSHKQTIMPLESELETLHAEHDILSSEIGRLRKMLISGGPDKESVQAELDNAEALLTENERQISVFVEESSA